MADSDIHLPLIQAGDADAFAAWLAAAEPRIRASLASYASIADTEAVLQESLLRTWQFAPRCEPDGRPDSLLRLVIRIARNLAVSEARRHRTATSHLEEPPPEWDLAHSPSEPDPMLRVAILRCVEKLPDKPGTALSLRLESAGQAPDTELAQRAGMTLNTFLQNFTRARRFLADCLRSLGIELEVVTP